MFLVGASNRPRKRKRTNREIPEKSGRSRKNREGPTRKNQVQIGNMQVIVATAPQQTTPWLGPDNEIIQMVVNSSVRPQKGNSPRELPKGLLLDAAFLLTIGSFLLTHGSLFTYDCSQLELFCLQLRLLYLQLRLLYFTYSGEVRLMSTRMNCKRKSSTVSKKLEP